MRRPPRAPSRRRGPRRRAPAPLAVSLAALLLLPAAAVAFPGARDDVLEWLGLRDVQIRRVPAPPAGARPELEADLGRIVTLAQARLEAGFRRRCRPRWAHPTACASWASGSRSCTPRGPACRGWRASTPA